MAYHRIYRYTSIARPPDTASPGGKILLFLVFAAAALGAALAWRGGQPVAQVLQTGVYSLLAVYGCWALARELDPDDRAAAFVSLAAGAIAVLTFDSPGILILYTTLGLVRMVNRSNGLAARKPDSFLLLALSLLVIYSSGSPLYGVVAGIAFLLDGSLREPLRHQWVFGLVCFGGTLVYTVDHDVALGQFSVPGSLFGWLAWLFLFIYALNILLLNSVKSTGDTNGKALDLARVRGGMAIGLLAAFQAMSRPGDVVLIVAVLAGICFGMAFRKGFKVPAPK